MIAKTGALRRPLTRQMNKAAGLAHQEANLLNNTHIASAKYKQPLPSQFLFQEFFGIWLSANTVEIVYNDGQGN